MPSIWRLRDENGVPLTHYKTREWFVENGLLEEPMSKDDERVREYTNAEAMEAALALVDEHFHNGKRKTKFCIPAELDDTDLTLCGYLRQVDAQLAAAKRDSERLEWLQEQIVDTIYLDDGRIVDVRGNSVRGAIDAAMAKEQK